MKRKTSIKELIFVMWSMIILFLTPLFTSSFTSNKNNNEYMADGRKIFYLDPSYSGSVRNGSILNPFKSFEDNAFVWNNNSDYLVKRSTRMILTRTLGISGESILISSYGEGAKPIIQGKENSRDRTIVVGGTKNVVKNIDVIAIGADPDNSAGTVLDMIRANNPVIENVKTTGGVRGMNASKTTGIARIIGCTVTDTWDDGMYHRENDTVIIEDTHLERVNLKYLTNQDQRYAGGDGIQFDYIDHFEIRNCSVDKTYTGGKFFIIADHFNTGIIEKTNMKGKQNSHGVYLGIGNSLIYRYNYLNGAEVGLWNKTANVDAYYNVFKRTTKEAYSGANQTHSRLINNTFTECETAILAWNENIEMHNNIFHNNVKDFVGNRNFVNASHNCYWPRIASKQETNSISADPMFIDSLLENYRLQKESLCIDSGISFPDLTVDIEGTEVPIGSSPDIGAYEYKPEDDTGIDKYPEKKNFLLYPNPAIEDINIYFYNGMNKDVKSVAFYSMTGLKVYEEQYNATVDKIHIDLPEIMKDGIYILYIWFSDNTYATERLMVVKMKR